jgi:Family of unknown function (DUF6298)
MRRLVAYVAIAGGALSIVGCEGRLAVHRSLDAAMPPRTMQKAPAAGPLRVSQSNPRYFSDGTKAVYLAGAHTWANLQDRGKTDPPPEFDFEQHLDFLSRYNHNFTRMWAWEHARWAPWTPGDVYFRPLAYERTGPGVARDGGPRFDLTRFDPQYFVRLRSRVAAAGARGIYVSVMLFQGWSIDKKKGPGNPWPGHPYHRDNNINGVDGDLDNDDNGKEVHTLGSPQILALQETYVRKVVDTLNDLDNVLWEISNESPEESRDWQYHIIRLIQEYEATKGKQHPVGMTALAPSDDNLPLFESPAAWVSPLAKGGYKHTPPAATGAKVVLSDTDHLWGIGGSRAWVWKSFMRGLNPIYMDDLGPDTEMVKKEEARLAMGDTLRYAARVNMARLVPRDDLASSTYCLADPGTEYLVYVPIEPHRVASASLWGSLQPRPIELDLAYRRLFRLTVSVDLRDAAGSFAVEWFDIASREVFTGPPVDGGERRSFAAPFRGEAVLYLTTRR